MNHNCRCFMCNQREQPNHIKVGQKGEDIVVKHLVKLGFEILDRNYRKKWGELDIVVKKDNIIHFVEVKTVSHETKFEENFPEENVHYFKRKRLERAIKTYLAEKKITHETEFQVDIISALFNPETKESKIRILENVIL